MKFRRNFRGIMATATLTAISFSPAIPTTFAATVISTDTDWTSRTLMNTSYDYQINSGITLNIHDCVADISQNGGGIFLVASHALKMTTVGTGQVIFRNNILTGPSKAGAGIDAENSMLTFNGNFLFDSNKAGNGTSAQNCGGGGAYLQSGQSNTFTGVFNFTNNYAYEHGGGMVLNGAKLTVSGDFSFTGNHISSWFGGGLSLYMGAQLVSTGTDNTFTFIGNYTDYAGISGGGISLAGSNANILDLTGTFLFQDNLADKQQWNLYSNGGALYLVNGTATLTGQTTFTGNKASGNGGAIYNLMTTTIGETGKTALFDGNRGGYGDGNSANTGGGGIFNGNTGIFTLVGTSLFQNNFYASTGSGGAIYNTGTFTLGAGAQFTTNTAGKYGGAIYHGGTTTFNFDNTTFTTNSARFGGAIANYSTGGLSFSGSNTTLFDRNSATKNTTGGNGGAIFSNVLLTLTGTGNANVSFTGNQATDSGGAIHVEAGGLNFAGAFGTLIFTGNKATAGDGGAFYIKAGDLTLSDSNIQTLTITGNTASGKGGVVYMGNGTATFSITKAGVTTWSGNTATGGGGFAYLDGTSGAVFNVSAASGLVLGTSATDNNLAGLATSFVRKTGAGLLTLNTNNVAFLGTFQLNDGETIITHDSALGVGTASFTGNATLTMGAAGLTLANPFNFTTGFTGTINTAGYNATINGALSGTGSLVKTGLGLLTFSAGGTVGAATVTTGNLKFTQNGILTVTSATTGYTTASNAGTELTADARLSVTNKFTQEANSSLTVALSAPATAKVTAKTAEIAGTLNVSGFGGAATAKASTLSTSDYKVITTTNGITGTFDSVVLNGGGSSADYLVVRGYLANLNKDYNVGFTLAWTSGEETGTGNFTLTNTPDAFEVDVVLANQTGTFDSLWNGKDLTKLGAGTLTLSKVNTYTGTTTVSGGTLKATIAGTIATSSAVVVNALFDTTNLAQTVQNLSGNTSGNIKLGTAILTINNSVDTVFDGLIEGTGVTAINKITGTGSLTLGGVNTFTGATNIGTTLVPAGRIIAKRGGSLGSTGAVTVNTGSFLQLDFASSETFANKLGGVGALEKTGAGTIATLSAAGSTIGLVNVNQGGLKFTQTGAFLVSSATLGYTTATGASTELTSTATLGITNALTQATGSTLTVDFGSPGTPPAARITAKTAALDGTLNINGFAGTITNKASTLSTQDYTVISTTAGITGDFSSVNLTNSNSSALDYVLLRYGIDTTGKLYKVGYILAWTSGVTTGTGNFTLTNASDAFDVDIVLANQTARTDLSWNGQNLTKLGAGTLTLSKINTYTGTTTVSAGTLKMGIAGAIASSSAVTVNGVFDMNNLAQTVKDLSGTGTIQTGATASTLTVNSVNSTVFDGLITGKITLAKTGVANTSLTLTGTNDYDGGTTIAASNIIIAKKGNSLGSGTATVTGTLNLDLATATTFDNKLAGTGTLSKTGAGITTMTNTASSIGFVDVTNGGLKFTQNGTFTVSGASLSTAYAYKTLSGASTELGLNSKMTVNGGTFVQESGSTLTVALNDASAKITAKFATIAGTLNIDGFAGSITDKASTLSSQDYAVIQIAAVTGAGTITGDFDTVTLTNSSSSSLDYIILKAGKNATNKTYAVGFALAWTDGGQTKGTGNFTLTNTADVFDVDVILANQTGTFDSLWNGQNLTKLGAGTLTLSKVNTYTGTTTVSAGILKMGIAGAIANSSAVTVNSVFDMNNLAQTVKNLSGNASGNIKLGTALLTINNSSDTVFSGLIEGTGAAALSKITGTGSLTLTGVNTFTGTTAISAGRIIAQKGASLGSVGMVTVNTGAALELNLAASETFANKLAGVGALEKTGAGTIATISATGSTIGVVNVKNGGLKFTQAGLFTVTNTYAIDSGASTELTDSARLTITNGYTQASGSTLTVSFADNLNAKITAKTAALAGTLNVSGFQGSITSQASTLSSSDYTVITTTNASNGITGDFDSVVLTNSTGSSLDYVVLKYGKDATNKNYKIGFTLAWTSGTTTGTGNFTLANTSDAFDVDVILGNQTARTDLSWNGQDLTKLGAGTLTLSKVNTYTGTTTVSAGILKMGIAGAIATSSAVTVNSVFDMNNLAQTVKNLSGNASGNIKLGTALLTINNSSDTVFSGLIEGTGTAALSKITGTGSLTLSGVNTFTGTTTISAGRIIAQKGASLGSVGVVTVNTGAALELNLATSETFANKLAGVGTLDKTGAGTIATISATGSTIGNVNVNQGGIKFTQAGLFTASTNYTTATGASTELSIDSTLSVGNIFTQSTGSTLTVALSYNPVAARISAKSAAIDGALNISGFAGTVTNKASTLTSQDYTIIQAGTGTITGDFTSVTLTDSTSSTVDYALLRYGKNATNKAYTVGFALAWTSGTTTGTGNFTLAGASDNFEVDVVLGNQTARTDLSWNGRDLTKLGAGTLLLSKVNTYTGTTTVSAGILKLGALNSIQTSSSLVVNGTLDLNSYNQIVKNLSGNTSGNIKLTGASTLAVDNTVDTVYNGTIEGNGYLSKYNGAYTNLTLTQNNSYTGGTSVNAGYLTIKKGGSLGEGQVNLGGTLQLSFDTDQTFNNKLSGSLSGQLLKWGDGKATLTATGSAVSLIHVNEGELEFTQDGVFNVTTGYQMIDGTTTTISGDSWLNVGGNFSMGDDTTLNVTIGSAEPIIVSNAYVNLNGTLNISGFTGTVATTASLLDQSDFTIITSRYGMLDDFETVTMNDSTGSAVDYVVLRHGKVDKGMAGMAYTVGFTLAWTSGEETGIGNFTLANAGDTFNVDVVLEDQTGTFDSGWTGSTLTKKGLGTLTLSKENTYTGATTISGGTLKMGIANAIADSSNVVVNATFDLDGYDQTVTDLSGSSTGLIKLGDATLTVNSVNDTAFAGSIEGDGSLVKDGDPDTRFTLSGDSSYSGGTVIETGTLVAQKGLSLGEGLVTINSILELDFATNQTFANQMEGDGDLVKTNIGTATLTASDSTVGSVAVNEGVLNFTQTGAFTVTGDYDTATDATTRVGGDSSLDIAGTFTQNTDSTLDVSIGSIQPIITAQDANIDGTLNINGFSGTIGIKASELSDSDFTILHTIDGITGDFSDVTMQNSSTSTVDYVVLTHSKTDDGKDYKVGFELSWISGETTGTGNFTLAQETDAFNVDVALDNQTGTFDSAWDGTSLTKLGAGTLTLSAVNAYTGSTIISEGILKAGIADTIASSSNVAVDGTFDLDGYSQTVNNLSGDGSIIMDDSVLTIISNDSTEFGGTMTGNGVLIKSGTEELVLSGTLNITGVRMDKGILSMNGASFTSTGGTAFTALENTTSVINITNQSTVETSGLLLQAQARSTVELNADNVSLTGDILAHDTASAQFNLRNHSLFTGKIDPVDMNIDSTSRWDVTGNSDLGALVNNGIVDFLTQGGFKTITATSLNGNGVFHMNVSINDFVQQSDSIVVNGMAEGTHLVVLKNTGNNMTRSFALPMIYTQGGSGTFAGSTDVDHQFVGSLDIGMKTASLQKGDLKGQDKNTWYLVLPELATGSGAQGVLSLVGMQTLSWQDTLLKRMGELRMGPTGSCAPLDKDFWVRGYGSRYDMDSGMTGESFTSYIYGMDLGGDTSWKVGHDNTLVTGLFAGYGRTDIKLNRGGNDTGSDNYYGGFYGTWLHPDGWYADWVTKAGWFDNEFATWDASGNQTSGSYDNWAIGTSLESGKQIKLNNCWYVEPQAQVSYTHFMGSDYSTGGDNVFGVSVSDRDLLQFRAGALLGRMARLCNGGALQSYVKAFAMEQISSGGDVRSTDGAWRPNADGASLIIGAGMIWKINSCNQIYVDYEAEFASEYNKPWGINVGFRHQF